MNDKYLFDQYKFYSNNIESLSKKYYNKYVVIKDLTVIGSYDDFDNALQETVKKHKPGTFIIQLCTGKIETQTFHSRVGFSKDEHRS
jgi:hypothetical protein